jgi:hypothetical protein
MKISPIPLLFLAILCSMLAARAADPSPEPIYKNDFESAAVDTMPKDMLVVAGAFAVKQDKEGKYLELPGEPLDTFGFLFGPSEPADVSASARFFGTKKGRKYPTFGVSLNGVSGYRLQVSPAKQALELFKGGEERLNVVEVPYTWASDAWTSLRIQVRKTGSSWIIEGKAWPTGSSEPEKWTITTEEKQSLPAGRAGIWGSPYSGLPIRFDDLLVIPAK